MTGEQLRVSPSIKERAAEALAEMGTCLRVCRAYLRAGESCAVYDPKVLEKWRNAFADLYHATGAGIDKPAGEREPHMAGFAAIREAIANASVSQSPEMGREEP